MKILTIPEQRDIDIGHYGPACEGFIDAIKNFFVKNPTHDRVEFIKRNKTKHIGLIEANLNKDLRNTYHNPAWVAKNLEGNSGFIEIPALTHANVDGKALTNPSDIVKVAQGMLNTIRVIAAREKPFIDHRRKLVNQIEHMTDPAKVDQVWLEHEKELKITAVDRFKQRNKKGTPALGYSSWPVDYKDQKDTGFNLFARVETGGKIETPTPQNAKVFADALTALVDIAVRISEIGSSSYVPYWDGLSVEYDDLKYGDEIFSYICSAQNDWEVSDLTMGVEYELGQIACGLYIAMFDKHMPVPANEGLVGDTINFLFKKKKDKSATNSQEGAEKTVKQLEAAAKKVHEFHKQPEAFKLTGRAVPVGAHLHLAINGKSPVVHSLPHALDKTFRSALELSKKFKKDMNDHARIAKPLIDKFEKDMLAVMERDGSVPQEALDQAMLPIIAAKASLEKTYFNSFGKDQHVAADWVGGNPFFMKEYRRDDGTAGWMDESYSVNNPCVAVDKADKIETLMAMAKEVLQFTEEDGWWLKLNGPFDTDANSVKFIDYEFDRPVRHLHDMMSDEQVAAIYTLYSFEQNTQSLFFTLCSHVTKVHESVLMYIDWSLEQI